MTIGAIAAIGSLASSTAASSATAISSDSMSAAGAAATSGTSFAGELSKGLDAVSGAQANADNLAVQAATGTLTDPAAYTVAATQASLMTELASAVQSKAVNAFNTIMGMQA